MHKSDDECMSKAHGKLILERENEIIMELRATREFLSQKIDTNHEEISARLDKIERDNSELLQIMKELAAR